MRFAYPGYAATRSWRSVDLGEAARAAVRSPDKAEGRIRGRNACQSRADACRKPVPGCASLVRAARLRVRGVQSTWPKRRGPQFVARIRPKAASGGGQTHANRGRTPAGSLLPDALRAYPGCAATRSWRSVDLAEAARAAVRSPDKAEGRIRGADACQSRANACREPVPGCASLIRATGLRGYAFVAFSRPGRSGEGRSS